MVLDSFSLADQVGIVTGGGQGLGRLFCHAFAEAGADIVVAEINQETGPVTAEQVRARGRRALFVETDVCKPASIQAMLDRALAEYGKIDFLMNNAGIVKWGEAESVTEQDWRQVIDVNLNGLFFCCQIVGRHMISRRSGRIINIASMSGLIVNRPQAQVSYNASKAAVIGYSRTIATQYAKENILVNTVCPGIIATGRIKELWKNRGSKINDSVLNKIPMGRLGDPDEVAKAVVFLGSAENTYITGAILDINGGIFMP